MQSHPLDQGQTWARSIVPTAFGRHRVSQGLRNWGGPRTQMGNGLHCAQEGGEGCRLSASKAGQGSKPHSSRGKRVHGTRRGRALTICLRRSLQRGGRGTSAWRPGPAKEVRCTHLQTRHPLWTQLLSLPSIPFGHSSWRILLKFILMKSHPPT